MCGRPEFTGPHHVRNGYGCLTDFVFNCIVLYKKVTADDGARFDVALTFDDIVDLATVKTTTSLDKTVVFNSTDLRGHFGTKVGKTPAQICSKSPNLSTTPQAAVVVSSQIGMFLSVPLGVEPYHRHTSRTEATVAAVTNCACLLGCCYLFSKRVRKV